MARRLTVDIRLGGDAPPWQEGKHPRGQPKNKGEFAKKGNAQKGVAPSAPTPATPKPTSSAKSSAALPKGAVKSSVAPGQTLWHGTNEISKSLAGSMLYLTPDISQAALTLPIDKTAKSPTMHTVQYKPGNSLDITKTIGKNTDRDAVVEAAAVYARNNGYRYLEFDRPNVFSGDQHHVIVSLYPKQDTLINRGMLIGKRELAARIPAGIKTPGVNGTPKVSRKPDTPASTVLKRVQTVVQKQLPVLKYGYAAPDERYPDEASLSLSNTLSPSGYPWSLPAGEGLIGVALQMNITKKQARFEEITSDPPGYGERMVKALLDAMPDYKFSVHVDLSEGFWNKMQQRYPNRFEEQSGWRGL